MPNIPGIQSWNRLEPRPKNNENIERALRAEVRDPLWMMTRQWQFGEFQAEDTGSAIFTRVNLKTTELNKLKLGNNSVQSMNKDIPLESRVEKEFPNFDLLMSIEMGRHWELILRNNISSNIDIIIESYRGNPTELTEDLNFQVPVEVDGDTSESLFFSNPELYQATELVADGRAIDGAKFYHWLKEDSGHIASEYITASVVSSDDKDDIDEYGINFIAWFEETYAIPTDSNNTAWNNQRMEYQFACASPNTDNSDSDVFVADEYHQGNLDWFSFDFDTSASNNDLKVFDNSYVNEEKFTVIPSPVMFKGMPHPRWWKMEDYNVDFGGVNPSKTDIFKVVFSEFGLIYSNDWMVFPYTVPFGSLNEIKELVVTDCFGQRTKVEASNEGNNNDWERWSFFGLHTKGDLATQADVRLFIPPVVNNYHESEVIESVNFIKDEVANMVWGIEQTIPNGLGAGMEGREAAMKHNSYLKLNANEVIDTSIPNDATIKYQLSSEVPENWIPFISVKTPGTTDGQTQLQRAAMPREIKGLTGTDIGRVRPRSILLSGPSPYYLFEEEVPRSGTIVKKTWQRARNESGKVITWFGTKKRNGRGEGNSNLSFDQIKDK